ncbi:hypothetical protein JW998_16605 [candidate division KSB1 bacterium]|nr:hypothetical protein [candidate division KSB1 bacterium]
MNRRKFLQSTALSVAALKLDCRRSEEKLDILSRLIRQNDGQIPRLLQAQQGGGQRWDGGIVDGYGIHSCGLTAAFIRDLTCAFCAPQSEFFQSDVLLRGLDRAAQFLSARQHSDSSIDLPTTNFHSAPDTAFVLEWLCGAYGLLQQNATSATESFRSKLRRFILRAGDALTVGGIHTPNHRWVICMALARANSLFPNAKYVKRIDDWLREGIDIDADGQFTEKSSSIYSPLTDRCLITIARLLQRAELYEPVRKNLTMTLYYVHPNGEVVTDASDRQDKYETGTMAPYYYPYRYMALRDRDGQFAAMSHWLEERPEQLTAYLMYLLEDARLNDPLPAASPLPTNYEKHFIHSNLARIRRERVSATILADNFTLQSFRKGEAVLQAVRCASAFFGKGQFKGERLERQDGVYSMSQKLDGPYYQPFAEKDIPGDGDWEKMPKDKRVKSDIQQLNSLVTVRENEGKFEINFRITGTERVPVAVELAFKHGGRLTGVEKIHDIKEAYFFKGDRGQYSYQNDKIEFTSGRHEHRWTQLRGAEDKLDAMSVYITGFTPFYWTLKIC